MGKYSVPESIRKFKPKGTMVKVINGSNYYVYEYKSIVDENGIRKTKMGKLIGKIIEGEGFIPNNSKVGGSTISTLEYGQYKIVVDNTIEIYDLLLQVFCYDDAASIYCMALINFINGFTPVTRYTDFYEQSYLNLEFNEIKMDSTSLSNLIDALGRRQDKVHEFENKLIENSSKEIAIDGHVIVNPLCNKYYKENDDQINLLMAYDINSNTPVTSRIYRGANLDEVSVKDLFIRNEFNNILFIVDRGFYSKDNIEMFSSNGNKYIIPISLDLKQYKETVGDVRFDKEFVYVRNEIPTLIEYCCMQIEGKNVYVFRDKMQNIEERCDYLKYLEIGIEGLTKEIFDESKEYFGTIVLETNLNEDAKLIYKRYKDRQYIETFFSGFKKQLNFNTLNQSNYYELQGLAFIMLISGMIQSQMNAVVSKMKEMSVEDVLVKSRFIKMHRMNGKWGVQNVNAELREMFLALNSALTRNVDLIYGDD